MSDGNVSVEETPLEDVTDVPDAKGYNFATGTCTMYQKGVTGDPDTASPDDIINKGGDGENKVKHRSRKRRRNKRTRKNKRKYRKSKHHKLPKLTRRIPYKKYS